MGDPVYEELLRRLQAGELQDELQLLRVLRSPYCSAAFVEAVAASPWVTSRHRILNALVRHRHCPRAFAWRVLPQLGWHDLLEIAGDPRTPMPVRVQAEAKLAERIPKLSLGEKTALARRAGLHVIGELISEEDPRVVAALLDNPKFTQSHCLRLVAQTKSAAVLSLVFKHPHWGNLAPVRGAILANLALPLPLLLALLVSLEDGELLRLAKSKEFPAHVRKWADQALWVRKLRQKGEEGYLH